MSAFIEAHRERFGVEPICRTLAVAPSTYYAARGRPPSARAVRDAGLVADIRRVHEEHYGVYGVRKVWHELQREGVEVGRDRVARLMRAEGLEGVVRSKGVRTTVAAEEVDRWPDLVERDFAVEAPDRLWVADLTYVGCAGGFCYTAFVTDAFARRIVGWRVTGSATAEHILDAFELAAWSRRGHSLEELIHHSDHGSQYLALRYTERVAELGARVSVGSVGDSYDNALAETMFGLYKAELIHRHGPWRSVAQVELATARWVHWWNERRLHSALGYMPPAEYEAAYWQRQVTAA
jgi:putative transposase